jgi:hypothetical protein
MGFETDSKRGVQSHYGPRVVNNKFGGSLPSNGIVKSAMWDFAFDELPVGSTSNLEVSIPANSTIISAKLYIDTAFTSTSTTSDLDIGLEQSDGTDIDANGLVTASEATQTTIALANSVITGAGALIGKTIGAAAGELMVIPTADDLLTGQARVVVEYVLDS